MSNEQEVAQSKPEGIYNSALGLTIELQSISAIPNGVVVFARAWRDDVPVGFGADGSVEIERFRVFRPPLYILDVNGKKVKDPAEALRQTLAHTISLVGKDGKNIIPGKVGHTTDTFYPSSDDAIYAVATVFATARDATTGTARGVTDNMSRAIFSSPNYAIERGFVNWDTSSIPDSVNISSATVSLYGLAGTGSDGRSSNIYGSTASDTIVADDFDLVGATAYCDTAIALASWNTAGYNDFALNATGLAAISLTGLTKVSVREVIKDVGNVAPTDIRDCRYYSVEQAGTANDPKLVVTYTAGTVYEQAVGGGITPAGTIAKLTGKVVAGGVTPAGTLTKLTSKIVSGAITPAGALVKKTLKTLGGAITPAGAIVKNIGKALAGSITPIGTLLTDAASLIRIFFGSSPTSDIITGAAPTGTIHAAAAPTEDIEFPKE